MKIYGGTSWRRGWVSIDEDAVHYEGSPDFTLLVPAAADTTETILHVKQRFVAAYNQQHGATRKLRAKHISLVLTRKRELEDEMTLEAAGLDNGEDVFVVEKKADTIEKSSVDRTLCEVALAMEKKQYRVARDLCHSLLERLPSHGPSMQYLAIIETRNGRHEKALRLLERALQTNSSMISLYSLLRTNVEAEQRVLIRVDRLGDVKFALQDYEGALEAYKRVLASGSDAQNNTKVSIGKTLYHGGMRGTAIELFKNVLRSNEHHPEALLQYAHALRDAGWMEDATRAFLKLLTLKPDDKEVRRGLTQLVRDEDGVQRVLCELQSGSQSAAALAFLATVIRDHGAIEEAALLYKQAVEYQPSHPGYALSYAHALEVCGKLDEAFDAIVDFCRRNANLCVGNLRCLELVHEVELAQGLDGSFANTFLGEENAPIREIPSKCPRFSVREGACSADGFLVPEELDVLALFFTLVKIVYVRGALTLAGQLIQLIEPTRAAGHDLHLTHIRNEHAYFCCMDQLMGYHFLPLVKRKPLFVMGDSHSLSPAWHEIVFKGEPRLLWPMLVTGCKAWHLRPQSDFYPKHNFWRVLRQIPAGSDVIFLFGEIDCREGLLVAVERCQYETIQEGIEYTVELYVSVLQEIARKHKFGVLVHPVLPVLNECRPLVLAFNRVLRDRVVTAANPPLRFLDFTDALLDSQGTLCANLELDGTHVSPFYLTLLQQALDRR